VRKSLGFLTGNTGLYDRLTPNEMVRYFADLHEMDRSTYQSQRDHEIFAGTITVPLLLEVYATLIALAALSLYGCAKWFERESTIFREN
jgi:hypothetical protein